MLRGGTKIWPYHILRYCSFKVDTQQKVAMCKVSRQDFGRCSSSIRKITRKTIHTSSFEMPSNIALVWMPRHAMECGSIWFIGPKVYSDNLKGQMSNKRVPINPYILTTYAECYSAGCLSSELQRKRWHMVNVRFRYKESIWLLVPML